jgi:hypothetical protein
MKFVHRSCLDRWRVDGFNPKTLTHCGTCQAKFRVEDSDTYAVGAEKELWLQIFRFISIRVACFLAVAGALGFLPPRLLGDEDSQLFGNGILNHFTLGSGSALALAGGYAVLQVLCSVNLLNLRHQSWSGGGKDAVKSIAIVLIILGAMYLVYQLVKGALEIMHTGRYLLTENVRIHNREMRERIVKRYRVLDFEPRT